MIYVEKENLPCISLSAPSEEIGFPALKEALQRHPSDLIYMEHKDQLYGLVSMGDIVRACAEGQKTVRINTSFRKAEKNEYLRAREIFFKNTRIHELPVTDEKGRLCGAFSRFDDLLFLKYWNGWDHCRYIARFTCQKPHLALVRPVSPCEECARQYALWTEKLRKAGFLCREIFPEQVPEAYAGSDLILFTDEAQKRGARSILCMEGRTFYNDERSMTFCELVRSMSEPPAEELFRDLQERGIHVLFLCTDRTDSVYQKQLFDAFHSRSQRFGRGTEYVHPEEAEAFYGDLYSEEYAHKVGRHMFLTEKQNSFTRLKDCNEPYFHIVNGERLTVGQPEKADSAIYFFGPCVCIGPYVEDGHTVESFLQQELSREGYLYRVINAGCWESSYSELLRIMSTPMKKGDIAVIFYQNISFPSADHIDLLSVLEENQVPAEWLLDSPLHCNDRVHRLYAKAVFQKLRDTVLRKADPAVVSSWRPGKLFPSRKAVEFLYLDRYFWNLAPAGGARVANIGIHGNPFTNGHLHLAKTALQHADRLIVLILEEERGLFSFAERFAMACAALDGLGDVIVAPSGPFHGTRVTFPEYFTKEESAMEENAENEFRIFGALIAPALGITIRFLGDENHNPMMQKFNRIVSSVLNEYGIETVEIPRKQVGGQPVSASAIRALSPEQFPMLADRVPPTTLAIMQCTAL